MTIISKVDREKQARWKQDLKAQKNHKFKYQENDRIYIREGDNLAKYIILSKYIENGEERYTIYPPSKRRSYGYHIWVRVGDIIPRGKGGRK